MTRLPVGSSLADSTTFSAAPSDTQPWYWHGQLWSRESGQDYDWRERGSTDVVGRSSRSPVESEYMTPAQYLDPLHIPAPQWGLWTSDSYGVDWEAGEQRTYPAHIRPSLNAARPATLDEVDEEVWVDVPTHGLPVIVLSLGPGPLSNRAKIQRWAELPVPQRRNGAIVAVPTGTSGDPDTLAHQLGPPSGFAAPDRAYADNWRLPWTYGTEYVDADDEGEQWEVMHSYDSLITIEQRQELYYYDDLELDWGDRRIIHPVVNGTSPFVRHPTDTGRVVAAWTPLYNLDPMTEVTPDGGCVFVCGETVRETSLDSRYEEYAKDVLEAIAVKMGGFGGPQGDPTGVVPGTHLYEDGDDWVLDVYIPVQYIAHNGHPEAGPGLDGEVVAHARRPEPDESDGYIGADTHLVAFPARIWTRPNQEVLDPGGGLRLQFAIDDVVGDITELDLTYVWIRFRIWNSFGDIVDAWPLDTVDIPPGSTTSDIIDLMVAEVNDTAGVSLTRLDDFLDGSPVRFHFLLQLTSTYVEDNEPFSVDIQIDVEWDDGDVDWWEDLDEDLQPEPPVIGPPEGWAIVADTHDTPHRFDRPLYTRRPDGNQSGGSVFGESWDNPTFVFQRRVDPTDDGIEGYLGGPTGYDHDTPGWLPSNDFFNGRGALGCAKIGQLPPGCWVLAHHVQVRSPSRSDIAERLANFERRITLVEHLTFSHFWIDQRPRTCPWATVDDDAAIVPGSLPAHDWERDLALPYTPPNL